MSKTSINLRRVIAGCAAVACLLLGTRQISAEPLPDVRPLPDVIKHLETLTPQLPTMRETSFDIRDYGAVGDGQKLDTAAFEAAIVACNRAGGGRVVVPEGVWLTGPIHLRSRVNLHLHDKAVVRFSTDHDLFRSAELAGRPGVVEAEADTPRHRFLVFQQRGGVRLYGFSPQIYGYQVSDVAITGKGTFDGQGKAWWGWSKRQPGMQNLFNMGAAGTEIMQRQFGLKPTEDDALGGVRPPMFQVIESERVLIDGPTFLDGSSWMLHPVMTDNLTIRNVRVEAPFDAPNTDGIDPDMCREVLVEDVFIATGDDAIAIKAGRDQDAWAIGRPTENVTMRRIRIGYGRTAIGIGSEISTAVKNVLIEDVEVSNALRGIFIKSQAGRGGVVDNIIIRRVKVENIGEAGRDDRAVIGVSLRYRSFASTTRTVPRFGRIRISDISGTGQREAARFYGLPDSPLTDVVVEDVNLQTLTGVFKDDAPGLTLRNVRIKTVAE